MSNSVLTPTMVLRESMRLLHQKANFIGTINRQYDDSFAQSGAKIGDSLKVRLPNQYTVTSGAALSTQDTTEQSVTLQVATQKHVDVTFTTAELTLSLDDFAQRILEPAMAVLISSVEADAMSMYKDVYNQVNNVGSAITFAKVLGGRKLLNDNLAPMDNNRVCNLNTQDNLDLVDALKGLFNDSKEVSRQYKEGIMGRTAGLDFYENTLWARHASGSDDGTGDYLIDGANQTGATLTVDTGAGTLKQGDILTITGVNRVHPETKSDTGELQQFVVTADVGASATSIPIAPAIVISGARQNVSAAPANNAPITKVGGAAASYGMSMAYHRDAFTFATADLLLPKGVDWVAREVLDGISLRIVRQYSISTDTIPCRIDILYGFKTLRPQLACRLANN